MATVNEMPDELSREIFAIIPDQAASLVAV
jgi:hypothetical protein